MKKQMTLLAGLILSTLTGHLHADDKGVLIPPFEYTFDDNPQGWAYTGGPGPFSAPTGNRFKGAIYMVATDNVNNFGFWESPNTIIPVSSGGGEVKGSFPNNFLIKWTMGSSAASQITNPSFRLRTFRQDFSEATVATVESTGDGTYSPSPDPIMLRGGGPVFEVKEYYQYMRLADGGNQLKFAFDMLNFGGFDDPTGQLTLYDVTVQKELANAFVVDQNYGTFDLTSDSGGFSAYLPLIGAEPQLTADASGLSVQGQALGRGGGPQPTFLFGGWEWASDIPLNSDKLYQLRFTVASNIDLSERLDLPTMRFRVNDRDSFQAAWYLNIDSTSTAAAAPGLPSTGFPVTYELYFIPNQEINGNNMTITFDYLWVVGDGNSRFIKVSLQELSVRRFEYNLTPPVP